MVPASGRIGRRTPGAVHVLASGRVTENGLTQHSGQSLPTVLAGSGICKRLPGQLSKQAAAWQTETGEARNLNSSLAIVCVPK